jgi:hypothetical protein
MMVRSMMLVGALTVWIDPAIAGGSRHYACGGYCDFDMNTGRWLADDRWRDRKKRVRFGLTSPVTRYPLVRLTRGRW